MVQYILERGISVFFDEKDVKHYRQLDSQKPHKKAIFGSGFLMSDKAAAEKAAAEKAAAEKAAADKDRVTAYDAVIGIFDDAEVSLVEDGPTHVTVRSVTRFGASWLQQDIRLFHHAPQISVSVTLFWAEQHRMLKLSFPTPFANATSIAETAGVVTSKPADGTERPCGVWFAACGTVGQTEATLGIATDAKHGFSLTPDGDLRMSVARSPAYALHTPHPFHPDENLDFLDQGIQRFHFL